MRSQRWSPVIKKIWWRRTYDSTLYPTCASSRARASAYTYPSLQSSQGGGLAVVFAEIDSNKKMPVVQQLMRRGVQQSPHCCWDHGLSLDLCTCFTIVTQSCSSNASFMFMKEDQAFGLGCTQMPKRHLRHRSAPHVSP